MNQAFFLVWDGDSNFIFWMKERLILKNKLKPPLSRQNSECVERNCKSTCVFFMWNKHWLCFKTPGRWDFSFPGVFLLWSKMTTVWAAISKRVNKVRRGEAGFPTHGNGCCLFFEIKCRSNNTDNSRPDPNNNVIMLVLLLLIIFKMEQMFCWLLRENHSYIQG